VGLNTKEPGAFALDQGWARHARCVSVSGGFGSCGRAGRGIFGVDVTHAYIYIYIPAVVGRAGPGFGLSILFCLCLRLFEPGILFSREYSVFVHSFIRWRSNHHAHCRDALVSKIVVVFGFCVEFGAGWRGRPSVSKMPVGNENPRARSN